MDYFHWISKYRTNSLSPSDKQAFEHELAESGRLQREAEAVDLMEALLAEGVKGVTVTDGVSSHSTAGKSAGFYVVVCASLALLLLITGWAAFNQTNNGQSKGTPSTKEWGPRFLNPEQIVRSINEEPVAYLPAKVPDHNDIKQKARPEIEAKLLKPTTFQKETIDLDPAELAQEEAGPQIVVMNTQVDEGATMTISSKDVITLKPGFHAKAGATFRASIDK